VQASTLPVPHELEQARLSGQGSYRWFGIKLYEASLWRESGVRNAASVLDEKFILELVYARDFQGEQIAEASMDEIRKLELANSAQQLAWLKRLREVLPDVSEGARLSGVNLPGVGLRFYYEGKLLNEIADAEFARAFFSIWLDERTSAPRLRNQLLGNPS
jgi:hypothetical protein